MGSTELSSLPLAIRRRLVLECKQSVRCTPLQAPLFRFRQSEHHVLLYDLQIAADVGDNSVDVGPAQEVELRHSGVQPLCRIRRIVEANPLPPAKGIEAASSVVTQPIFVQRKQMDGSALFADDHAGFFCVVRATIIQKSERDVERSRRYGHQHARYSGLVEERCNFAEAADKARMDASGVIVEGPHRRASVR